MKFHSQSFGISKVTIQETRDAMIKCGNTKRWMSGRRPEDGEKTVVKIHRHDFAACVKLRRSSSTCQRGGDTCKKLNTNYLPPHWINSLKVPYLRNIINAMKLNIIIDVINSEKSYKPRLNVVGLKKKGLINLNVASEGILGGINYVTSCDGCYNITERER